MFELYVNVPVKYRIVDTAVTATVTEFFDKVSSKTYQVQISYYGQDPAVSGGGRGFGAKTEAKFNAALRQALACVRNRCKSQLNIPTRY